MTEQPRDLAGAVDVGSGHYLRGDTAGLLLWSHPSCRGWFPLSNHQVAYGSLEDGRITVRGSLRCPSCGVHGWIIDGRWSHA